jgi:hypothetical protein
MPKIGAWYRKFKSLSKPARSMHRYSRSKLRWRLQRTTTEALSVEQLFQQLMNFIKAMSDEE